MPTMFTKLASTTKEDIHITFLGITQRTPDIVRTKDHKSRATLQCINKFFFFFFLPNVPLFRYFICTCNTDLPKQFLVNIPNKMPTMFTKLASTTKEDIHTTFLGITQRTPDIVRTKDHKSRATLQCIKKFFFFFFYQMFRCFAISFAHATPIYQNNSLSIFQTKCLQCLPNLLLQPKRTSTQPP
jgi:hypothetical protein